MKDVNLHPAICLLAALGLAGCDKATKPETPTVPVVGIVTLQATPVMLTSDLTGRTTATLSSDVRPQITGIIQKRLFREGDDVHAGQALFKVDSAGYKATYDQAAASLDSAKAQVLTDCRKAQRYTGLVRVQGISQQDTDDARATCEVDKASVKEKAAALESARVNLQWTTITAPIAGRIGISSVTPGALVSAEQDTALATIRSLDEMFVDLTQSSKQLLALRKQALAVNRDNLAVTLTLEDGSVYPAKGRLELTEVAVDEATGSVTMRAIFPNPDHILLPGMFVHASVENGTLADGILVPQAAVSYDVKGNASVLLVSSDNKIEQRNVTTGSAINNHWLILDGLKSGERVVVEGSSKVATGETVTPVAMSEAAGGTD
ncbi:efflux RND transporter periplasmic adaptor subunit [Acerihabitans sp. KWT182]|uniref:Efflux RND transporter periplasmic adaptor subunit n=1 Tax=Acerihabitans sp. KWT182 TaxID=3157919 RepID=A0AAU7QFH8_9GAMM